MKEDAEMEQNNLSPYEKTHSGGSGKGKGMVKPEDMALLQEKLFETLVCFADFCDQHGIHYCLVAGTCIGAAREHDFIPWDDDLDVAVLRSDYEKLFRLWDQYGDKEHFSLYRTTDDFCAYTPIGLLRNNSTTFIRPFEGGLTDRNLGVKIDIEPYDEISDNKMQRKIQRLFSYLYVLFLTQRKARNESKVRKIGTTVLLAVIRGKKMRNWIIRLSKKQVTKYNGTGCKRAAINALGFPMALTDFSESTELVFHGRKFKVPADYDGYLRREYGDYLQKPPTDKRFPMDEPIYYNFHLPYSDYLKNRK